MAVNVVRDVVPVVRRQLGKRATEDVVNVDVEEERGERAALGGRRCASGTTRTRTRWRQRMPQCRCRGP